MRLVNAPLLIFKMSGGMIASSWNGNRAAWQTQKVGFFERCIEQRHQRLPVQSWSFPF